MGHQDSRMDSLERKIGYKFKNPLLLAEALTHPSRRQESKQSIPDNQRLEFLGDAVLQLIFTEELFDRFADFPEGLLTKLRIRLVSRKALASFADKLELGNYLRMGKGEISSGGQSRLSNLANTFEALVGAIYRDGGLEQASRFVLETSRSEIRTLVAHPEEDNPKGQLQEILQTAFPKSPQYKLIQSTGPDHCKVFTFEVVWNNKSLGKGIGHSKKEAEIEAARNALANPEIDKIIQTITDKQKS